MKKIFSNPFKKSKRKSFLLVCWFDPNAYGTIVDHIYSIKKYSQYEIEILNLFGRKSLRLPFLLRLNSYAGIIFHNTITYNIDNVKNLTLGTHHNLQSYHGLKILMKQDECLRVHKTVNLLKDWNFDLLLTCIPEKDRHKVYPKSELPNLKFFQTLTGYLTDEMRLLPYTQEKNRLQDIVYRGMKLPYFFGELAMEKYEIGEKFKQIAVEYKLNVDISSRIEDRVFGTKWFDFLGHSRAVLAVESGASIFDFDGKLEIATQEYLKNKPDATFKEVQEALLLPYENLIYYNQISPRHFEAAATRTLQIMYEGEYSGIFLPDVHYLSLKKDYSNLAEVMQKFSDYNLRKELTDNAHRDIICNDVFSYKYFVEQLDKNINSLN
jgi:hypothetical protein